VVDSQLFQLRNSLRDVTDPTEYVFGTHRPDPFRSLLFQIFGEIRILNSISLLDLHFKLMRAISELPYRKVVCYVWLAILGEVSNDGMSVL
jgi:hypothetical protein